MVKYDRTSKNSHLATAITLHCYEFVWLLNLFVSIYAKAILE